MNPVAFFVDDEKEAVTLLKSLCPSDWVSYGFENAVEALKKVDSLSPDLIVSDVFMPGIHGLDFVSIARSILKTINVVVISANTKDIVEDEVGSLEGLIFFQKPLGDEFFNYLDQLMEKAKEKPLPKVHNVNVKLSQLEMYERKSQHYFSWLMEKIISHGSLSLFNTLTDFEYNECRQLNAELDLCQQMLNISKEENDILWEQWGKKHNAPKYVLSENPLLLFKEDQRYDLAGKKETESFIVKTKTFDNIEINDRLIDVVCHERGRFESPMQRIAKIELFYNSRERRLVFTCNDSVLFLPESAEIYIANIEAKKAFEKTDLNLQDIMHSLQRKKAG